MLAMALLAASEAEAQPSTGQRVDARGAVFLPDPLTSARAVYGQPGFVDGDDADSPQLTEQLVTVTLPDVTYDGAQYVLSGPWAEAVDVALPADGPFASDSAGFFFTRSEPMFEAVNAYYHIDRFMRYLNDTLGVAVRPYQYEGGVRFDPHGTTASIAYYSPQTGIIALGDGNVDKGEDADVILHELGHGIQDWITGGDFAFGGVLGGTADYWANSYNRSFGRWTPDDEPYYWIFHWVSHNEFGPGRVTNYEGLYPDHLVGSDHIDGQILSSALMQVWDQIGREATDRNVLAALALTSAGDDQQDFARAFVEADRSVHEGRHLGVIVPIFEARGYALAPTTAEPLPHSSAFALEAPFPNPTRGQATIRVTAAVAQQVRVVVTDLLGRHIDTLYDGPLAPGESKALTFDGRSWPAGVYVVQGIGEHATRQCRVTLFR